MKQQTETVKAPKVSKISKVMMLITTIIFALAILVVALFVYLNTTVKQTEGKVIGSYFHNKIVGKRSSAQQEYLDVQYIVDNKEHSTNTQQPQNRSYSTGDKISVFYYQQMPSWGWCFQKSNMSLLYSILAMLVAAAFFAISLFDVKRELKNSSASKNKVPKKKN